MVDINKLFKAVYPLDERERQLFLTTDFRIDDPVKHKKEKERFIFYDCDKID